MEDGPIGNSRAKPCFLQNSKRQQGAGGIQVRTWSLNAMELGPLETAESRAASADGRYGKQTRHSSEGLYQGLLIRAWLLPVSTQLQSSFEEWQGRNARRQEKAMSY